MLCRFAYKKVYKNKISDSVAMVAPPVLVAFSKALPAISRLQVYKHFATYTQKNGVHAEYTKEILSHTRQFVKKNIRIKLQKQIKNKTIKIYFKFDKLYQKN